MPLNPSERTLRAQIAANESWAHTDDRAARTAPARKAALDKFEHDIDPLGELLPAERAKRAEYARKAYFQRLALKSAQARRRRASLAQELHADLGVTDLDVTVGGDPID